MRRLFVVGQVFRFLKLHVLVLLLAGLLTACGNDSGDSSSGSSSGSSSSSSGTGSWTATTTTSAPSARYGHTAVWTGSEMIVWGGTSDLVTFLNTGGKYNPTTDSWTATATTSAPSARMSEGVWSVWTGSEMIIWGGNDLGTTYFNTGGRYNPSTDSWTATTTTNAPTARNAHVAVWTGSEMIVWGGWNGPATYSNTGGRYNPTADSWTATSTTNAPTARQTHKAVWTGTGGVMIVWGGTPDDVTTLNTGGKYNPSTDSWAVTSTTNAPTARYLHTAVWTGSQMIVWGGRSSNSATSSLNTGGRYTP